MLVGRRTDEIEYCLPAGSSSMQGADLDPYGSAYFGSWIRVRIEVKRSFRGSKWSSEGP
jgi:hypothetical protein